MDEHIQRADFGTVVEADSAFPERWGDALVTAEAQFERAFLDYSLLQLESDVSRYLAAHQVDPGMLREVFYRNLDARYSNSATGYYLDTYMLPHELVNGHHRLILGACKEKAVQHLIKPTGFFEMTVYWILEGYYPVGWSGRFPEGTPIIW